MIRFGQYASMTLVLFLMLGFAVPAGANDVVGNQGEVSRVITQTGEAPPINTEYRRPADENFVIASPAAKTGPHKKEMLGYADSGSEKLTGDEIKKLNDVIAHLQNKDIERIEIIGSSDVQALTKAGQDKYQDNKKLSELRAQEAATFLKKTTRLKNIPIDTHGVGERTTQAKKCKFLKADKDLKPYQECLQADRRIDVHVWYRKDLTGSCSSKTALNSQLPFRIAVDGEPVAANDTPNSADTMRCTDVNLEKADIQVRADALEKSQSLNITATPNAAILGEKITFTPYTNYATFLDHAELRIFLENETTQSTPLKIVPVNKEVDQAVTWDIPKTINGANLKYLLRVYDRNGRFDETAAKSLTIIDKHRESGDEESKKREALIGYGENHLALKNIDVDGGAVTVNGTGLKPDSKVWVWGREVPVDKNGAFAYRQIIPAGERDVNVVTQTAEGTKTEFNRPVPMPKSHWFYVGQADVTIGQNNVKGPATLVTGDDSKRYRGDAYADGRLAFYTKGKMDNDWHLTASADTEKQPIENLFSNFSDKNPRYLLKRIDPSAYYPVYGDDSTSVEDAPTQGKFFVKLEKDETKIMWGNFATKLTGTDLMNYSRTLYGANAEYASKDTTKYGEKITEANGFAADPGTLDSLEEFRGTGGSLYYLRAQDIVVGSERLRVEIRDRDSGIVLETRNLVYGQDYEVNYLQGRIILRQPLSSTDNGTNIINTGSSSGNYAYLVAGYEYTPGVSAISSLTKGGRISHWVNDYLKVGATTYNQSGTGSNQDLKGADATIRYAPGTYLKLETAGSEGPGTGSLSSINGGFNFNPVAQTVRTDGRAKAYRAETAINLSEVTDGKASGTVTAYTVKRDNGFSAPGQITDEAISQTGLAAHLPVTDVLSFDAKTDIKTGSLFGNVQTGELDGNYQYSPANTLTLAVRHDNRDLPLGAGGNSEILSETGQRTDAAVKVTHAPVDANGNKGRYDVYGIAQATIDKDSGRSANNRAGVGGDYTVTDRVTLNAENTVGNGGLGGKAGIDYKATDRTSYYTNYLMDSDRSDTGYRGRNSSAVIGAKKRYSDEMSVFTEQRFQGVDNGPSGIIHSFGLDLAPDDRWTWGGRVENGTVSDKATGDTDRTAFSLSSGYNHQKTKYGGTLEWRKEDNKTIGDRDSWLMKNNFAYQTTPDWRLQTALEFAISNSGLTSNLDADYTEASIGYAYRPVLNDRFNALFKYTYLSDRSSPGQLSATGTAQANDYEQRSHVLNMDAIYDLTPKWSVGTKFGYRIGQLRDTTAQDSEWFSSQAYLGILHADWHVVHEWDITGEARYLKATEAKDAKAGVLVGAYRHVNENVKIGAGFNFTDFSDDLTNLSYRSYGPFMNVIGKF